MPGTLTILEKWTQKEKLIKQISQQDRMLVRNTFWKDTPEMLSQRAKDGQDEEKWRQGLQEHLGSVCFASPSWTPEKQASSPRSNPASVGWDGGRAPLLGSWTMRDRAGMGEGPG